MQAWSNKRLNVQVEDRTGKQPCQAVCAAVCSCHKLLAIAVEDYSFDVDKFVNFLEQIAGSVDAKDKIFLFLDNSSVHRSKETKKAFERLEITPVWNVSYHF